MTETKYDILKIPQGKSKPSADEKAALDIIEKWDEEQKKQALNAKIAESSRRVAEYMSKYRHNRQQKLFKAIDVAMWSALLVGILALGVIM